MDLKWTRPADVYSFGVLASEVLQPGMQPLAQLTDEAVVALLSDGRSALAPRFFGTHPLLQRDALCGVFFPLAYRG